MMNETLYAQIRSAELEDSPTYNSQNKQKEGRTNSHLHNPKRNPNIPPRQRPPIRPLKILIPCPPNTKLNTLSRIPPRTTALRPQHQHHSSDPQEESQSFDDEAEDGAGVGAAGEGVGFQVMGY